jgi:hypothetical protein
VISLLAFVNGGMALAFVGVAALLHRRRLASYFTTAPRFRWRLLLLGLGLFAVTIGPLLLASAALDPKAPGAPILAVSPDLAGRSIYAAMIVSLLSDRRRRRGAGLPGLAAQDPRRLVPRSARGAGPERPAVFGGPFRSQSRRLPGAAGHGRGPGLDDLRLGGIEFAIGAHAANNIMILLFIQPMALKPEPPHGFPPETLVIAPLMLAGYVALAEIAARWAPLRRWTRLAA